MRFRAQPVVPCDAAGACLYREDDFPERVCRRSAEDGAPISSQPAW